MLNSRPIVSVVICTYKRYDLLHGALESLERMQVPSNARYEVIVVENTPESQRADLKWVRAYRNARVSVQDEIGLSAARNRGIESASAEIVAFLDDDAEVSSDWLTHLIDSFQQLPHALVIGGRVSPVFREVHRPIWLGTKCEQLLSCIDWGDGISEIGPHQWVVGANVGYRRSAFEKYGLFQTHLGRKGTASLLSNDESEFNSRLPDGVIYYSSAFRVDHVIPAERVSQAWFRRRVYWQAVSDILCNSVDVEKSRWYRREYMKGLMSAPASKRISNPLMYDCVSEEEFELQLNQIYNVSLALAAGGT